MHFTQKEKSWLFFILFYIALYFLDHILNNISHYRLTFFIPSDFLFYFWLLLLLIIISFILLLFISLFSFFFTINFRLWIGFKASFFFLNILIEQLFIMVILNNKNMVPNHKIETFFLTLDHFSHFYYPNLHRLYLLSF